MIAASGALVIVGSLTAGLWYPGQLCRHWSAHATLSLLPALLCFGRRPMIGVGMLTAMVAGAWPWLSAAHDDRAPRQAGQGLSVVTANIYSKNPTRAAAVEQASTDAPELLCLVETTGIDRQDVLADPRWPHQIWAKQVSGISLLSTKPFAFEKIHPNNGNPFIEAVITLDGVAVRVLAVHAASPRSQREIIERNRELTRYATLIDQDGMPALVLGDFNITVADPAWPIFCRRSGVRRPPGHEPATWPSVLGPFGITIDHILARDLALDPVVAISLVGSDHRGLATRVALPRPTAPEQTARAEIPGVDTPRVP
ncbi:MAG: endonuclease/exonuclease/phosphatase family protein [Planctomycetes bacterium]|nr:endonuclease/exonuclease/phosphatase family protein [Planctomycetota bacterium]